MVGVSLGVYGICIAIVQGVLIRPILRRIGEARAVILGPLDRDRRLRRPRLRHRRLGRPGPHRLHRARLDRGAGAAGRSCRSTAADDQQGELQGTLSAINAVAVIVAPLMMTQIFWYFTSGPAPIHLPGAPFLLSALLTLVCIGLFQLARRGTVEAA